MSWVDELKSRILEFDPGFLSGIRPAAAGDILELTSILRTSLPEDYREFLAAMGKSDGGLFYTERIDSSIDAVISYCERILEETTEHSFERCIPIAVGVDFEGLGIIAAPDGGDRNVVFLSDGQPGDYAHGSLPAMCFSHGFMFEQCATGSWVMIRSPTGRPEAGRAAQMLEGAGYARQWFSSARQLHLRQDNKLITILADDPRQPLICVGARERSAIEAAVADLSRIMGDLETEWTEETTLPQARQFMLEGEEP